MFKKYRGGPFVCRQRIWTVLDLALDSFEIPKFSQNPRLWQPLQKERRQIRRNPSERLRAGPRSTEQCCRRYRPPLLSPSKKLLKSPTNCFFHFQNCPKLSETVQNCPKISNFQILTSGSVRSDIDGSACRRSLPQLPPEPRYRVRGRCC